MTHAERAVAACAALRSRFASGHHLYHEVYPRRGGSRYAHAWPYSQVLAATLDLFGLEHGDERALRDCLEGLARYWDGAPAAGLPGYDSAVRPPLGKGGDKYYDDNAWIGLALVRAYRLSGDAAALDRAREVLTFIVDGWADPSLGDLHAGGVYWKQQRPGETNRDRNVVSNAPTAELALRLYAITGDAIYLTWARRLHGWVEAHLRDADDGLYRDHLVLDGDGRCAYDTTRWSYNQGTMIGAKVLLHQVTGARVHLERAHVVARAALRYFDGRYTTQGPAFNAIYFRNLLLLSAVADHTSAGRQLREEIAGAVRGYATWAWETARDPTTNLFWFDRASGAATLIDQAAMVAIYACLASDPVDYDLLV